MSSTYNATYWHDLRHLNWSYPAPRTSRSAQAEGLITEKILYEISKSLDFRKDFKISGEISRFPERFQDFRKDFKISGKISRFHARFQNFQKDYARFLDSNKDFQISMKISARFGHSSANFDILILNSRWWHTCRLTQWTGRRNLDSSIHYISCIMYKQVMYKELTI